MSVWAHPCRRCSDAEQVYFVASSDVAEMPPHVRIVKVRVGREWHCAALDRGVRVDVDGALIRQALATDATECAECVDE